MPPPVPGPPQFAFPTAAAVGLGSVPRPGTGTGRGAVARMTRLRFPIAAGEARGAGRARGYDGRAGTSPTRARSGAAPAAMPGAGAGPFYRQSAGAQPVGMPMGMSMGMQMPQIFVGPRPPSELPLFTLDPYLACASRHFDPRRRRAQQQRNRSAATTGASTAQTEPSQRQEAVQQPTLVCTLRSISVSDLQSLIAVSVVRNGK